jgi:calcineurin-like phosphoesterase family protein
MEFLTADQHWGHANVIGFCDRPFDNVEQMDRTMIDSWNSRVKHTDTVYHLGDLTLGGPAMARGYIGQLFGRILMVSPEWHHDRRWMSTDRPIHSASGIKVEFLSPLTVINYHKHPITLCHYPMQAWERSHYGAPHAHGHSHGRLERVPNRFDVGVDSVSAQKRLIPWAPITITEFLMVLGKD